MRASTVLSSLGSGMLVYAAMAACSGGGGVPSVEPDSARSEGPGVPRHGDSGPKSPVPNAMADEWYAPGSRLKIRYLEWSDGARQFAGWYDSERKEECTRASTPDGGTRCLPLSDSGSFAGSFAGRFSDPECTSRIAIVTKSSSTKKYAFTSDVIGVRIFQATPYTGATYRGAPGNCVKHAGDDSAYDLYSIGPEIAADNFTAGDIKTAP